MDTAFIQIRTVVLGYDGDLFVGGNFATRVWDGHHFVYVYHVARYDGMYLQEIYGAHVLAPMLANILYK
ncbi:hypothetical protein EON65_14030 [archaeon]|nr:MAG: hypothetical protein EON65_14030 [archaeon]